VTPTYTDTAQGSNVVVLSGWLIIDHIWDVPMKGQIEQALRTCILTRRPPMDPNHISKKHRLHGFPALLTGKPAELILNWARRKSIPPRVVVEGKLRNLPNEDTHDVLVEVKYLDIMELESGGNGNHRVP
jgi:hypothetical protein